MPRRTTLEDFLLKLLEAYRGLSMPSIMFKVNNLKGITIFHSEAEIFSKVEEALKALLSEGLVEKTSYRGLEIWLFRS